MRKLHFSLAAATLLSSGCRQPQQREEVLASPILIFQMRSFEKTQSGCGDHGSRAQACVSFRAVWPELNGGQLPVAAAMNAAVQAALGFPAGQAALAPYGEELIERWRVEHRGVVYADSTWFERRMIEVLARRPGVWSFQVERIGQTGLALPFDERSYLNLNPRTGGPVTLESLLVNDSAGRFTALVESRLRSKLNLAHGDSWPFKEQRFQFPAQFALSPAGVLLAWSGADLRDPALARIEICMTWDEVGGLLRPTEVKPPSPEFEHGF